MGPFTICHQDENNENKHRKNNQRKEERKEEEEKEKQQQRQKQLTTQQMKGPWRDQKNKINTATNFNANWISKNKPKPKM